ncbi:MAG: OmpA family protein [Planctomycetaceae bacterium]|nr:OmpA family protein [Planctomycetaceae bacterium]
MSTLLLRLLSATAIALAAGCQAPARVERYNHPLGGQPLNTIVLETDSLFCAGRWSFTAEDEACVKELAEQIRQHWPKARIVVFGHTDSNPITKTPRFNSYEMSQYRAEAVKAVFVAAGFTDVWAFGMGPDFPIATNATVQGKRANRRVEIVVIQKE